MKLVIALLLLVAVTLMGLAYLAHRDRRADRTERGRLTALQPSAPELFTAGAVAGLPEPARRYFTYMIRQGTPLWPVVRIEMAGKFSLGKKDDPRYQRIEAQQILAAPDGFVWEMKTRGGMPLSGSDSAFWTRFRLFGLVPVARMGGDNNHARSAFARMIGEAVIWSPAALMPGPNVSWSAAGRDAARVSVRHGGLEQAVDVTVDAEGKPLGVSFARWSNANTDKSYRLQPFGALVSDFREVGGYRLPFHVEAGNMFGTDEYFPFFVVDVTRIDFPGGQP